MMPDPTNALLDLQRVLDAGTIQLSPGRLVPELGFHFDRPHDAPRFTYALVKNGKVQAVALFARAEPVASTACFNIGYAVLRECQRAGLGTRMLSLALKEFTHGLRNAGVPAVYVEAVVAVDNLPSNRLAKKLVDDTPKDETDSYTGQLVRQYLRKIDLRPAGEAHSEPPKAGRNKPR